uniref:ATP synthase F0 subunit 6 n=1 Tax=Lamennaisia ambigua TaxID=3064205 RepID=UPI00286AC829|nr:ATP synthase F0 subunit 6 [Lamennaisia ambigua]WKV28901.1 ATP synthase F0 subunit 6 [Lamennaisia ambigua]
MMNNLFSIFDPSSSFLFSLNWLISIMLVYMISIMYWFIPSRWNYFNLMILSLLVSEFKVLLSKKVNVLNLIIFISAFMYIFLNNFMGLFPYIFTSTSHLSMSLALSLSMWLSYMIYGWINHSNHMFTHLVPQGTPSVLMPFMVVVESLSNYIRFGTLSVRLTANMIAGHLLMTLISSTGPGLNMYLLILMILSQSILIILELSVSIIQAYVFSVLSTLYSAEVN